MKIPIQRIKNNKEFEVREKLKNIDLGRSSFITSPAVLTGTLTYVGNQEIFFEGHLSAKVQLTCVHCLKEFEQSFEIDISESYIPSYFVNSGQSKEERSLSELDVLTYNGTFIDSAKIVRDILIEHIPPYPLCPECRAKE